MWNYNYTDELYHYGVLGMKWGVRRYRNKDGTLTSAGKKKRKEDSKETSNKRSKVSSNIKKSSKSTSPKSNTQQSKSIKEMSDAELKAKIERLNLENRYKELMRSSNPPKHAEGKAFVKNILKKSGDNLLPQVLNHYGAKALNNIIGEKTTVTNKQTGEAVEVLKEVIFANNKKKDK